MRSIFLFNHAPVASGFTLSGNVYFWCSGSAGVNAVTMSISGAETKTVYTDSSGAYSFSATASGLYVITPKKHKDGTPAQELVTNGLTSTDVTMIQSFNSQFNTFYQYIAGDANGSNSVSAFDASLVSDAIGGGGTGLSNIRARGNWRFVQTAFTQSGFPPASWAFPSSHSLAITSNTSSVDFYAIKVGDVNGSADITIP